MTRPIKFSKLSGAGNDFVLVEGPLPASEARALARRLCRRREGVGADGLLVADRKSSPCRVEHRNGDGSRTFCGNGARCAAWWLVNKGWAKPRFSFFLSGIRVLAVVAKCKARLSMPEVDPPRVYRVVAAGRRLRAALLDTGVPHAVVKVTPAALERLSISLLGRALRRHPAFGPNGANADFSARTKSGLRLRTYERGVEDETLACGTGAVAAALVSGLPSPVRVEARGGILSVAFKPRADGGFSDVWLEGPVRHIFTGEVAP